MRILIFPYFQKENSQKIIKSILKDSPEDKVMKQRNDTGDYLRR